MSLHRKRGSFLRRVGPSIYNHSSIALSLSPADYEAFKQALLKAHTCSVKQAAQQMWEMRRSQDMTCRAWASRIKRAVLKMLPDGDPKTLVDSLATEKFLRSISKETATFARNADPTNLEEAADMAT